MTILIDGQPIDVLDIAQLRAKLIEMAYERDAAVALYHAHISAGYVRREPAYRVRPPKPGRTDPTKMPEMEI
jgi:hypothetical protein